MARWLLSPDDAARLLEALDDEYVRHQLPDRTRIGADVWYWRQVVRSVPALRFREGGRRRRALVEHGRIRGERVSARSSSPALRAAGRGGSASLDLLHVARRLRRSPVSAGAAILTLSLTLGAGTSIIAVVDAVLLEPPPFTDPDALVAVVEAAIDEPPGAPRSAAVGHATFEAWRARAGPLAEVEAFDPTNLTLTGLGAAERVSATNVTPGLLRLLGVAPVLGRTFEGDDLGRPVAVVSHTFWRGRLAADPAAIGRQVVLGGRAHTIVGVLPDDFLFALNPCDLWRPFPFTPAEAAQEGYRVRVIARLAPHASAEELAGALGDVSRTSSPPARVVTTPVAQAIAGDSPATLALLGGAAGLAMLIAFANLAVLLIVRSIDRRRELAVRRALGAPPSETARQLLLEAVALVAPGILGGVLLALWITPVVSNFALEFGGLAHRQVPVGWRAIGVVGALAFGCACVCGLLPAVGAARWRIAGVLRRGSVPSGHELGLRRPFVAGEVALAFVLLVSMALLGRSLLDTLRVDPGFDPRGVLKLQVSLPLASYGSRDGAASFYSTLQSRLQERLGPGVVSRIDEVPLTGDGGRGFVGLLRGDPGREAVVRSAGPDYFDVMRIPVSAGRSFDGGDDAAAPPRVVISRPLASGLFGAEPPVGRQLWVSGVGRMAEIVGVVGDVRHRSLDEAPLPTVYLSALQFPSASSILVVRSARPDAAVIATVREAVAELDGDVPVYSIRSMRDVVEASPGVPARRLLTAALGGFALLAVVLSTMGLFGVAAHDVERRRAELAVRVAVGADPMRILRTTLGRGALMLCLGVGAGAVLSIWSVRWLGGVVSATEPADVLGIGLAVAGLLMATGAIAILPAAIRAARSDPLTALRSE